MASCRFCVEGTPEETSCIGMSAAVAGVALWALTAAASTDFKGAGCAVISASADRLALLRCGSGAAAGNAGRMLEAVGAFTWETAAVAETSGAAGAAAGQPPDGVACGCFRAVSACTSLCRPLLLGC